MGRLRRRQQQESYYYYYYYHSHHYYFSSSSLSSFTSSFFLLLLSLLLSVAQLPYLSYSFPLQEATTTTTTLLKMNNNNNNNNPFLMILAAAAQLQQQQQAVLPQGTQQPPLFPTTSSDIITTAVNDLSIISSQQSTTTTTIASSSWSSAVPAAFDWIWPHIQSSNNTPLLRNIQKMGETMLVAMMVVAFLQAAFAAIQYRTNPDGELIVPPGLTYGTCYPNNDNNNDDPNNNNNNNKRKKYNKKEQQQQRSSSIHKTPRRRFFFWQQQRSGASTSNQGVVTITSKKGRTRTTMTSSSSSSKSTKSNKNKSSFSSFFMKSLKREEEDNNVATTPIASSSSSTSSSLSSSASTEATTTTATTHRSRTRTVAVTSAAKTVTRQGWNRISQWLIVLLPIIRSRVAFYMSSSLHIFHLTFAVILANFFDFPNRWFFTKEVHHSTTSHSSTATTTTKSNNNNNNTVNNNKKINKKTSDEHQQHKRSSSSASSSKQDNNNNNDDEKHIIVIGDSLAVGLGCYDIFDKMKNNTLPYSKIENLGDGYGDGDGRRDRRSFFGGRREKSTAEDDNDGGPVFPRVLSETLADCTNHKVTWRSAGVDGGDTQHIMDFLLSVIEEEVDAGRTPDIVVILCGINDLKRSLVGTSIRQRLLGPRLFRARLRLLIRAIRRICLKENDGRQHQQHAPTIVLPSLPTQMFHKNSPLNIFPLNFFLDTILGLWDSQKRLVAEQFARLDDRKEDGKVLYLGLGPSEVLDWYRQEHDEQHHHHHHHQQQQQEVADDDDDHVVTLISADGIHPNAKCYELWASSLGKRLSSVLL